MSSENNNTKITVAIFGAILAIIITVPVVYGYLFKPADKQFLGITGLYPIEQFYYLSIGPSQAVRGHVLFADKYGRLPDGDVLLNPIANVIALISFITSTSLPISFNIFRILSTLLLIFSFYYLSKQFIASSFTLLQAVVLYCFSAGFGSLFELFDIISIDTVDDSMPEANMFIAMSGEYYLPLANALFILALAAAYRLIYGERKGILLCGFSLLLLGAVYVYGLVSAVGIISIAVLYKGYSDRRLKEAIVTLLSLSLFCLPVATYYLWLILRFPSIDDEGWFPFPGFLSLLSTFGFGFLFAITGLFLKSRVKIYEENFLLIWVIATVALIYLSKTILPIQIQMLIGLGAPLSIMFATTLETISKIIFEKVSIEKKQAVQTIMVAVTLGIVVFSCATNYNFYKQQFSDLQKQILPWYIDSRLNDAIEWSVENISDKSLVITSRKMGFIFSSATAAKVYTGVASFSQKTPEQRNTEKALSLISVNKVEEARRIFSQTEADYLFFDKSLSVNNFKNVRETLKTIYKECYSNSETSIFQLK